MNRKRRTDTIGLVVNATGHPGGNEWSSSVYYLQQGVTAEVARAGRSVDSLAHNDQS